MVTRWIQVQSAEQMTLVEEGPPLRKGSLKARLISFLAVRVLGLFASTWRLEVVGRERLEELLAEGCNAAFWHGRAVIPGWFYRNRRIIVMVSLHADGEIMNWCLARMGYIRVRGSTTHGGREALGATAKLMRGTHLTTALTPDGPKGPLHSIAPGLLLLAARTGKPIVPIGVGARARWELNSWDRYLIPKPFTRVRMVVGEPIHVPSPLRKAALEEYSERVRSDLIALEEQAARY